MFTKYIQKQLEKCVRNYFVKHAEVKLVVVAGSVGKTSAKTATATVLSKRYRVRLYEGAENTGVHVPLAILGIDYPGKVRSLGAWISVLRAAKKRIKDIPDVDVIIQELGSNQLGDMDMYGTYIRPDVAIITSVGPGHSVTLSDIEAVAKEELAVANFSKVALINRDDIDGRFANYLTNAAIDTYGTTAAAEYRFEIQDVSLESGYTGSLIAPEFNESMPALIHLIGEHSIRPAIAAATVAIKLGMLPTDIVSGLADIQAVPGRMNILRGREQSIIIDDTHSSNPADASAALQTLYSLDAPQRIAILGSMDQLGSVSAQEHTKLGEMCDPNLLAWVITIGDDAERYIAPSARSRGCQVKSFKTAVEAGAFAHSVLDQGAVILAKGAENDIYAEEAVKVLLRETHDDHELVRQSPEQLRAKAALFSKFS